MKTIAITGATGFVGRHLHAALKGRAKLKLLTRTPRPDREGVNWIPGALEDRNSLANLVEDADAVIHLAGLVKARRDLDFLNANRDGALRLLDAVAGRSPTARVIHVSSLAARQPGLSPYAASKYAAEAPALDFGATIIRPPGIYGPGDVEILKLIRLARRGLLPAPGSSDNRVSLIYGPDLADLLARLALSDVAVSGLHEVDDGKENGYSYRELAVLLADALGRPVKSFGVPGAALLLAGAAAGLMARAVGQASILSAGKARELLHPDWVCAAGNKALEHLWRPKTGFAEGVRAAIIEAQSRALL